MNETDETDSTTPLPQQQWLPKLALAAVIVSLVVFGLLHKPVSTIEINPPTLRQEATVDAYLENLDTLAAYADSLDQRRRNHSDFRRLRFADYREIRAGAERLAAASPAIRDDAAMWTESQRTATAMLHQLASLDYALTAAGL